MMKGSIFKHVALLSGAKGVSQGLVLAASPLLTRLFSPEDFGVFVVFGVLLGLFGNFSCMKYQYAMPLARDEAEAANIFALCWVILGVFLLVLCLALLAVQGGVAGWLNSPGLQPYLWLLPLGVLGVGLGQTGQLWAIRHRSFKRVAASGMLESVVILAVQIGLGFTRLGPGGLIFGRIGGILCGSLVLLYPAMKEARSLLRNVSLRSLIDVAKRYRQFLFFHMPSSGISTVGRQMPVLILTIFFGPAVTGLYALTRRVVNIPMMLIGDEVRRVYYPFAADTKHDEDLRRLTKTIFMNLVQIALPGVLIIGLVAPELFALVFGERWADSGVYAQWLCPWLFASFICSPLTRSPLIRQKQRGELIFQTILLIARVAALMAGGVAQDVMLTMGLFAGVSLFCWVGYMIWSMGLIGIGVIEIFRVLGFEFLIATPIAIPLMVAKFVYLGPDDGLLLVAVGAACALVAAVVLIIRNRHIISLVLDSKAP
jgi:O-antigen/teichoic acid export membrane protein